MMQPSGLDGFGRGRRFLLGLLLFGLVFSGVAGIINQVLWQRALKIYLAGSEAVSAMIVVFVFMLGLGFGSQWAGRFASRLRNPIAALASVEFGLAVVNSLICGLLAMDLTDSIYSFQRVVASLGIPLRVLYSLTAILLLTGPCLLMGMTIPLATEGCQRQLHIRDNRFLGNLFFLNTLGAVIGALVSGFLVLPIIGQKLGLILAVGLNSLAGLSIAVVVWRQRSSSVMTAEREAKPRAADVVAKVAPKPAGRIRPELLVGFGLGFLSLAYEMYLFRIASLVHGPFPFNFSLVLALFLLTWSIGTGMARFLPRAIPFWLVATAISMAIVPQWYQIAREYPRPEPSDDFFATYFTLQWQYFAACFIPCILFGVLFTQVVARFATSWGSDVGRYFAYNTFGSCAGILAETLVGFEFAPEFTPWSIAIGLVAIWLLTRKTWRSQDAVTKPSTLRWDDAIAWGMTVVFLIVCLQQYRHWDARGRTMEAPEITAAYYGKGG